MASLKSTCLCAARYSYMRDVIYDVMTKIIGSPNNISHSSICAEAENFGDIIRREWGGYRDYDVSNTKYLVIWGCDPTNSNRMVPAFIKRYGDVLIMLMVAVVDPRQQTTASKAQEWMPIIPVRWRTCSCTCPCNPYVRVSGARNL